MRDDAADADLCQHDLEHQLAVHPGLIPVEIDADASRILWVDLEQYHCYQGLFQDALHSWASIRVDSLYNVTSSIDVLDSIRIPVNSLAPTGFIFHAGRCGSTLLAQVLARSRENMVFAEATPHNRIWRRKAGLAPDAATNAYRNLFLVMGRRRLPSYRFHIVKFTSFNILKFQQIRAAFPGVPAVFLYREPTAILDSYHRSNPSWMGRELGIGHTPATPETAIEAYFRAALSIRDPEFRCLDYSRLTPESIPSLLRFLRLNSSPSELKLMLEGFSWDAKSGIPRPFVPRRRASVSGSVVPGTLRNLYTQLTRWKPLLQQDASNVQDP